MAGKGQKPSPEHLERMRLGREAARLKRKVAAERAAQQQVVAENEEDFSLPGGYGAPPPVIEEDAESSLPEDSDPSDPYTLWLALLDRETRETFGPAKLKELWTAQRAKAAGEKRARLEKEITALALSTARSQLGLIPAQTEEALRVAQQNAKMGSMLIQLPPAQENGEPADIGLRINGEVLHNGTRHRCTYGEAASIREMLYRTGQAELLFKGQNMRYRSYLLGQALGSVSTQIDANERGIIR